MLFNTDALRVTNLPTGEQQLLDDSGVLSAVDEYVIDRDLSDFPLVRFELISLSQLVAAGPFGLVFSNNGGSTFRDAGTDYEQTSQFVDSNAVPDANDNAAVNEIQLGGLIIGPAIDAQMCGWVEMTRHDSASDFTCVWWDISYFDGTEEARGFGSANVLTAELNDAFKFFTTTVQDFSGSSRIRTWGFRQ